MWQWPRRKVWTMIEKSQWLSDHKVGKQTRCVPSRFSRGMPYQLIGAQDLVLGSYASYAAGYAALIPFTTIQEGDATRVHKSTGVAWVSLLPIRTVGKSQGGPAKQPITQAPVAQTSQRCGLQCASRLGELSFSSNIVRKCILLVICAPTASAFSV